MMSKDDLIMQIEGFLNLTKMPPSVFGRKSIGDPNLLADLKTTDRSPSLRTISRILDFIANPNKKNKGKKK